MSAAAQAVRLTPGFSQIPNSLIEHLHVFTRAELLLALIAIRRKDNRPGERTISDAHWQKWTGLDPRTKKAAIQGLRSKGLVVEGRGDQAVYDWAFDQWARFVRTVKPEQYKPRTAGRGVDPPKGAKVHPSCSSHGCALLNAEKCEKQGDLERQKGPILVTPLVAPLNVQRVAQGENFSTDTAPSTPPPAKSNKKPVTPSVAPLNVQRVAQTDPDDWSETEKTVQEDLGFKLAGKEFRGHLVDAVHAAGYHPTDQELAFAVKVAYRFKRPASPGLLLKTVPDALEAIQAGRIPAAGKSSRSKAAAEPAASPAELRLFAVEILKTPGVDPSQTNWAREILAELDHGSS